MVDASARRRAEARSEPYLGTESEDYLPATQQYAASDMAAHPGEIIYVTRQSRRYQ